MRKIIVAHPYRQHSLELAAALIQENNLFAYCTTVYDKKNSFMGIVKTLLKGDLLIKANGRKCAKIDDSRVYLFCELRGYFSLFLNRYCKNAKITRAYQRYLYRCFGKKVAKFALKNKVDTVITFESAATSCFSYLKKKNANIECILDMAAISRPYAKYIYEIEDKRIQKNYFRETQEYLWNDSIIKYISEEISLADRFITASSFTANSVEFCGRDKEDIAVIPYGIDISNFIVNKRKNEHTSLNVVFVGHVDYPKGIHYLLESIKSFDINKVKLDLYGVYNSNSELYQVGKEMKNVTFHGFVTRDKLNEVYGNADVFIFPTTNDGYGFVVLEAMACGLPILCSKNAGACDLIEDGINGFTFESGDVKRMNELLQWCMDNNDKLPEMGKKSREKVSNCTWEKYNQRVNDFVSLQKK